MAARKKKKGQEAQLDAEEWVAGSAQSEMFKLLERGVSAFERLADGVHIMAGVIERSIERMAMVTWASSGGEGPIPGPDGWPPEDECDPNEDEEYLVEDEVEDLDEDEVEDLDEGEGEDEDEGEGEDEDEDSDDEEGF